MAIHRLMRQAASGVSATLEATVAAVWRAGKDRLAVLRHRMTTSLNRNATTAAVPAAPPDETVRLGGVEVAVWHPAAATTGPAPLVIFSHGFNGCSTQSSFLMRALAADGCLVLAPSHRDAARGGAPAATGKPERPFRDAATWDDRTHADRAEDIQAVVAGLRGDTAWAARADLCRVVLAGYSLGGYTVLGLAGGWPAWQLDGVGIKAVLALAPYCEPFVSKGTLAHLSVPVMYQGGTRDHLTPTVKRPGGAYASTGGKTVLVELAKAGHLAWTDGQSRHHADIVHYSRLFLATHLGVEARSQAVQKRGTAALVRVK